jgi:hypothetical protein
MVMATDELVRKTYTGTTQAILQPLVPKIWAAQIEKNLRKASVLEQSLLQNTDLLVPGAGDTVYVPSLPDLGAVGAITEGTDMTVIALNNATSVPLVPSEYGTMISITRKALDRIKYDGVAEILDRLSYAMSQTIEGQIAGLWNASVPTVGGSLTQVYANSKSSTSITANDTFNDGMILNGIATLEASNNFPWPDGYYRLYCTPTQYISLLQDTNTRQDLRWAAPDRLLTNEKGALHGVRIITTNYIKTATENGVTVAKALLVAPRWAVGAWKRRPAVFVDPTLYDGGRRRQFGVTADFDIELLHNERAVVLASA